ncbi:hypothetical protein NEUTE1DRAFT_124553 [Neurospora tetrasperma FGSC 2508]|uniref:polynucleotide adenylyltransferase n=1 Tax=Neurospora tetrasperma (strain FGSC 2508 / ATCC MYA-4615 / P0657) TaxID=510951 RepID=F8MWZ1_NEUT8|nr:uncharacterized protein NEUTE1DRAFT_124553 [Neurospora tetrasperma FGSC 2508]EGO54262.1 hypothetical protein NEUTE1DRAFT_124553 [Neurospora tetrasperma FGSC 2508]EGZ68304.1 hypothetical protein NEUTE2DRAFT_118045 [Neurospora tetrasperma FGSC 2509]
MSQRYQNGGGGGGGRRRGNDPRDDRNGYQQRAPNGPHGLPARPPQPTSYRPSDNYSNRNNGGGGGGRDRDNYRPPQGDFSFRVEKPPGVSNSSYDNYRPNDNRQSYNGRRAHSPRGDRRHGRPSGRGRGRNAGPHGGFRKPWRPFVAAERELLSGTHESGNEEALYNPETGVLYRNVDELSDSDEAEMDISGDEAAEDAEPSTKRARTALDQSASDNNTPKWSNPDPYTALPPEGARERKTKDVVQMIRKARVQTAAETKTALPNDLDEIIMFNSDSDSDIEIIQEVKPTGKAARDSLSLVPVAAKQPSKKPEVKQPVDKKPVTGTIDLTGTDDEEDSAPVPPAPRNIPKNLPKTRPTFDDPTPSALGSRKRTHDDEIKLPHARLKKATRAPVGGKIQPEWRAVPKQDSCPWMRDAEDHSASPTMGRWLHKEIIDFYEYVKPRAFEKRIREEVLDEINRLSDALKQHKLAFQNEVEIIAFAKVPLVKWVDSRTGLKIDVSFENDTGLQAIKTFHAWRDQFPVMPVLVTLIKHFLCMRGLNEPVNGGIGGFTVTCLVTSMLQLMPQIQSGSMDPNHHVGDLLMHFFDLYGNRFNYRTTAICLNPPKYLPKHKISTFAYKNYDRFSIIDPNNSENDIAGGSSNTGTIVALFKQAYELLAERMAQLAQSPDRRNASILEVILAGNYSTFRNQRAHLEKLAAPNGPAGPRKR